MKKFKRIILLITLGWVLISCQIPKNESEFQSYIQDYMDKTVERNSDIPHGQVLFVSSEGESTYRWSSGGDIDTNSPFHVASVGKIFTAVLIAQAKEENLLDWDSSVQTLLGPELLKGLFVFEGVDYSSRVTVGQLLNHSSGSADYFSDPLKDKDGLIMEERLVQYPEEEWTPEKLIAFTRDNQEAVGMPGEKFHYSDTGYILLGLILEKVNGVPLYQLLEERIFQPAGMEHTSLMFYPSGKNQELPATLFEGTSIETYPSLSMDWAGGGLISTPEDLARFARALMAETVLKGDTLDEMFRFDAKFMRGIHYGYGFMEYRFGDFFPTLKSLPVLQGHMGILGTQLMMDREKGTILVVNYGSSKAAPESVKTAIQVLAAYSRIDQDF